MDKTYTVFVGRQGGWVHKTYSSSMTFCELFTYKLHTKGREKGRTNASWKKGKSFRKKGIFDLSLEGGGGIF